MPRSFFKHGRSAKERQCCCFMRGLQDLCTSLCPSRQCPRHPAAVSSSRAAPVKLCHEAGFRLGARAPLVSTSVHSEDSPFLPDLPWGPGPALTGESGLITPLEALCKLEAEAHGSHDSAVLCRSRVELLTAGVGLDPRLGEPGLEGLARRQNCQLLLLSEVSCKTARRSMLRRC